MIMFILTINYVVLFYYEMILYAVLKIQTKNNTYTFYIHALYQSLNPMAVISDPSIKVIRNTSRENNLIFIVSHVT